MDLTIGSAVAAVVIVVTATDGYRHESIETAEEVIAAIARDSGRFTPRFVRTEEEMNAALTAETLGEAKLVMFVNTTGELRWSGRQSLLDWIAAGGSFIGVHSASDTWHEWPEYLAMIGGEFASHPPESEVSITVDDPFHPSTRHLSSPLTIFEEIYEFKGFSRDRVHLLLSLQGAPLAWHRPFGKGRVFYTALGHRADIWQSDWFQQHLRGAIEAMLMPPGRRRAVTP
ncbi:MAG TPA: ThuA domain-containing protein [Thermoanaerobaculia bacterium]|nr:ThuA domain-containing protein [Thermoanaerobaculia bacterium]